LNVSEGDLYLTAGATAAIDKGTAVPSDLVGTDIDGTVRGGSPDVGADEYGEPDAVIRLFSAGNTAPGTKANVVGMFELNGRVIGRSPATVNRRAGNGILLFRANRGKTGTQLQPPVVLTPFFCLS
jgi:hypothetical protein